MQSHSSQVTPFQEVQSHSPSQYLSIFVVPALRQMQGLAEEAYLTASVKTAVGKKQGLRFFAKAHATSDANGQLQVEALPGQESFKISPLMTANCWLIADEDAADRDLVRGGQDADIHLYCFVASYRLDFFFLDCPKQFYLHGKGHFAYFI